MITNTAVVLESIPSTYFIVAGILTIMAVIGVIIYAKVFPSSINHLPPVIIATIVSAGIATAVFGIIPMIIAHNSNLEAIESRYSVIITSKDNWSSGVFPITNGNRNRIEKYEVSFKDGSLDGEFDELKGEIRIKEDRAVLFYAPDSPDEMVPYDTEQ